jgi:hypothetical protein
VSNPAAWLIASSHSHRGRQGDCDASDQKGGDFYRQGLESFAHREVRGEAHGSPGNAFDGENRAVSTLYWDGNRFHGI